MSIRSIVIVACGGLLAAATASAQNIQTYKAAVVALTDDNELRASFERDLVAAARGHDYDAVTSYDIVSDVRSLDDDTFLAALASRGIRAVLMLRPAAVGAGSSLESVRNEVPEKLFSDMQRYAKRVSKSGPDDLIAVVHLGIYVLNGSNAELVSAGAVWLDEPVTDRAQGIERLQSLIVANVDSVRPALRRHLGLPPLP